MQRVYSGRIYTEVGSIDLEVSPDSYSLSPEASQVWAKILAQDIAPFLSCNKPGVLDLLK
jgi:hypothetical protein